MARIQGDRIVLREFWQEDLEDIHSWVCDPPHGPCWESILTPRADPGVPDNRWRAPGHNFVIADGQPEPSGPVQFDDGGRHRPKAELAMVLREECTAGLWL